MNPGLAHLSKRKKIYSLVLYVSSTYPNPSNVQIVNVYFVNKIMQI